MVYLRKHVPVVKTMRSNIGGRGFHHVVLRCEEPPNICNTIRHGTQDISGCKLHTNGTQTRNMEICCLCY